MQKHSEKKEKVCVAVDVVLSEYLGAFAEVVADLNVAVVRGGQFLQHLLPLVGLRVGLLQTAELLVGRLEERHEVRAETVRLRRLTPFSEQAYSCGGS